VAVDDRENLYVLDGESKELQVYDSGGSRTTRLRNLSGPISIAVDANGRIFIGSAALGSVNVHAADSTFLHSLGIGEGEFARPIAIGIDRTGMAYVVDSEAHRIKVFHQDGRPAFAFGSQGNEAGAFNRPTALAINSWSQELVIADLPLIETTGGIYSGMHEGARIQIFDLEGNFVRSFGGYGAGDGLLLKPMGVAADAEGHIYVADAGQNAVQIFAPDGRSLGVVYDLDHPLRSPLDIAVSSFTGRLFIASINSGSVEVYGPAGQHVIAAGAEEGGAISPAGAVEAASGSTLTFTITANDGYHVADVEVDSVSQGALPSYTFTDVRTGHTIRAFFVAGNNQTITASAGQCGKISPSGTVSVRTGSTKTFSITPDEGCRIADVQVDSISQGVLASYTFTGVTADHSIEAFFAIDQRLTVAVIGAGSVLSTPAGIACPGECAAEFAAGTGVTLTAVADGGMTFAGWSGACTGHAAQCTVPIDGPQKVAAYFMADTQTDRFESGDLSTLPWLTGDSTGTSGWRVQSEESYSGDYAVQAPLLASGQTAFLEVTLDLVAEGEVFFWHRESADGGALLLLAVDGIEQGRWSDNDWAVADFNVSAGKHTFRWEYIAGSESGSVWLDEVVFPEYEASALPVVDIKVNTVDGPLSVAAAEKVLVTVGLLTGERAGEEAEWWLAGETPFGWCSYDPIRGVWQPGLFVSHQGPLADVATHLAVLADNLPAGLYTLYFGVDERLDNDMGEDGLYDAVILEVGE